MFLQETDKKLGIKFERLKTKIVGISTCNNRRSDIQHETAMDTSTMEKEPQK